MESLPYGIAPADADRRLPADLRLGPVRLQIADLERSVTYYTRLLGLRLLRETATTAVLGTHDEDEALVELHQVPGVAPVPRGGLLGLYHFAILLPDRPSLGRFLSHLTSHGVRPGASDHLVSEALYLTDPDGLGIEVYADKPRSEWRTRGRELEMASLPLDGAGVVAAAAGVPWTGMPAGTRMGHLHLHVGDIDGARAFYHERIGLDQVVWSYPGALFLSAGGYHHHLGLNTWAAGARAAGPEDARLIDWSIRLATPAQVEMVAARLEADGLAAAREAAAVTLTDPWGTRVRVDAV